MNGIELSKSLLSKKNKEEAIILLRSLIFKITLHWNSIVFGQKSTYIVY